MPSKREGAPTRVRTKPTVKAPQQNATLTNNFDQFFNVFVSFFPGFEEDLEREIESVQEDIALAVENTYQRREELKRMLAGCFSNSKVPATPKKNFKSVIRPKQPPRVVEFDDSNSVVDVISASTSADNVPVIVSSRQDAAPVIECESTNIVIQDNKDHTPTRVEYERPTTPVQTGAQAVVVTPVPAPRSLKPPTPAHLGPLVVPGTPSPGPGLSRPYVRSKLPRSVKQMKPTEEEEQATLKRAENLKEKQERKKYENEQRKRRVEENKKKKLMEETQKKEEHRAKHDAIKKFQEEQRRTPGTPAPRTPAQSVKTPGQKAVPPKRVKGTTPISRPKPLIMEPENGQNSEDEDRPATLALHQSFNDLEIAYSPHRNQLHSHFADLEEEVMDVIDVYEMTPEKVPLPSTEEDYNVADLSSNDETDDEEKPRKKVPSWAQKEELRLHIASLKARKTQDQINAHFGQIRPPRVDDIFGGAPKRTYRKLDETTLWDSPIGNPRPAPLQTKPFHRRPATLGHN